MNYRARRDAANPYELHRTLSRGFANNGNVGKFLFRIESAFRVGSKSLTVLILSDDIKPNFDNISEKYPDYFNSIDEKEKPNEVLKQAFVQDAKFYFRLIANVTRKKEGKRFGIYDEEEQMKWLERKGQQSGFKPLTATISDFSVGNRRIMQNMAKGDKDIPKQVIFNYGVRFDGMLKITDSDVFLNSYLKGIGPAKSFGFGLMTVKPIR